MQSRKEDVRNDQFFGHSANAEGAGVAELLREHLRRVAAQAGRFSAAFGAEEQGRAAGLLHDLPPSRLQEPNPSVDGLALILRGRYAQMFTYTFLSLIAAFHANRTRQCAPSPSFPNTTPA
jgi:hypothetical protein